MANRHEALERQLLLPGVEQAVVNMRSGDVWELSIPPNLAFGEKGRPSSPGKPRIPGGATINFTIELVSVPGKDDELIELDTYTGLDGAGRAPAPAEPAPAPAPEEASQ